MSFNPNIHHRRSIRLKGYDYAKDAAYFTTICTHNREYLFGEMVNGGMVLNDMGKIIHDTWNDLPNHNNGIELDQFIVMPNHIHGIVCIVGAGSKPARLTNFSCRAGLEPAPTYLSRRIASVAFSEIVRQLKTFSARRINHVRATPGLPVWQRNYYEHIVRDDESLYQIREYIINNPRNWANDDMNVTSCGWPI